MPLTRVDLALSAVVREALSSIVREMRRSMVRSSYSSIIYEGYDFSCVLLDANGRLIAESGEDHPFHIIPVAGAVEEARKIHDVIGPGDILLHNDPYTGGTHLNDVAVIWPVYQAGALAFFVVIRSHWGDVGGMSPGSLNGAATDILQEGVRLNYIKVNRDAPDEAMRLIFDNVRVTSEAVSDFQSVLGICRIAEKRLGDLTAKYGLKTLDNAIDDILDVGERRLRATIRALQNGSYTHVGYLDGNHLTPHPLHVAVELTVEDDQLIADFAGSSPQVDAPLNAGPAIAPTSVLTVMKSFLDPRGAITSGTLRAINFRLPTASIVNAQSPAPCGGLNEVRFACDAALMGALGKIIPERLTGDVRGTSNHTYIGAREFIFYEYPSGGTGGWSNGDGNTAVRAFNEGENVSIQSTEIVEAIYPLKIQRNEIRPDSGGSGQFRGGVGLIRDVQVKTDGAFLSVLSDRNIVPPAGVNGGLSGAPNRYSVLRRGEAIKTSDFPGKIANFKLMHGDVLRMESSGGGGWGQPQNRNPEAIKRDLTGGYITKTGREIYSRAPIAAAILACDNLSNHQCQVSKDIADRLNAAVGDLIEITARSGPSIRVWIGRISSETAGKITLAAEVSNIDPIDVYLLSTFSRESAVERSNVGDSS
ncbi:MAG: hydantoinase B/oxoprolinase family protein [Pseudomonadota bacterium]